MPKPATIDRRVARTRGALERALIALILKKGYDAVTVEEICAEANIGRSTFYAHFAGKDDLKRSGLDRHLRAMLKRPARAGEAKGDVFGFALPFLEHARDHLDLYRALITKGGAAATLRTIRRIVAEEVRRELPQAGNDAPPRETAAQFLVGAFMSLLTWWLDSGAKLPAQRVDAIFRRLATEGIAQGRKPSMP